MKLAVLISAALLASVALASSPVGTWTGKFNVKTPAIPANLPAAQKTMMARMVAKFKTGKMMLTLKADHTYTIEAVGLPFSQKGGGTWSQKGNVITAKASRPGAKPQLTTMSKDGKHLTNVLPNGQGTLVFSR